MLWYDPISETRGLIDKQHLKSFEPMASSMVALVVE